MKKLLIIIPAKGNSQGVSLKNLQLVGGISLLARTLILANEAADIFKSQFLVSTESSQVFEEVERHFPGYSLSMFNEQATGSIANLNNRLLIHKRSEKLSDRLSKTSELVVELMSQKKLNKYQHFLLLQPTSPFRFLPELLNLVEVYFKTLPPSLVSVKEFESPHPEKRIINNKEKLLNVEDDQIEKLLSPRQTLGEFWAIDGAYYLFSRASFNTNHQLLHKGTRLVVRKGLRTVGIDTKEDLAFAQFIAEKGIDGAE